MPSVQKAHDELKKEGIQVVTVSIDGTGEQAVRPFFEKRGYALPAWIDLDMNVARGFGVRAVPYTVIVDTRGMITARGYGHVDFDGRALRKYVRELAARK